MKLSKKAIWLSVASIAVKLVMVGIAWHATESTAQSKVTDYKKYYSNLPVEIARPSLPSIPNRQAKITSYGAVGDGVTLCTEAVAKAIDELASKGGGRVIIPEGVWLCGPIELKSHIELHLEKNALLVFSPNKKLYVTKKSSRCLPAISAKGQTDIAITGHGTIDGNGKYWRPVKRSKVSDVEWKEYAKLGGSTAEEGQLWFPYPLTHYDAITDNAKKEESKRADLFRPTDCERILLSGVTFQNSPRFHVHPCQSTDIVMDGITVRCPWNVQNGDGIDLSNCKRALIVNSTVDVGDDAICMKSGVGESGVKDGPVADVLIEDCTVYHGHGGFVVGSDCAGGMERIVVRHLTMSGTDTGLRFKSATERGGRTEKIFISDIVMNDIKDEAITFSCSYVDRKYNVGGGDKGFDANGSRKVAPYSPEFTDINIERVVCREAATAVHAEGMDDFAAVHDIKIKNSTFFFTQKDKEIDKNCSLSFDNVHFVTFDK